MYIGIIGYRGEDKTKIARLYGETLSWMINNKSELSEIPNYDYTVNFMRWCEYAENIVVTDHVYYASFSHPLKMVVSMITGISFNYFNDHSKKNDYIINIDTLECKLKEDEKIITPEKLFKMRSKRLSVVYDEKQELPHDTWMTLNDYVIYFGYYLCRNYIGKDIWTNVERIGVDKREPYLTDAEIRIYTDVRNRSEYDFIREKNGVIIRLNKEEDINCEVYDKTLYDIDVDITIEPFSDIRSLCDKIYKDCYQLIHKDVII